MYEKLHVQRAIKSLKCPNRDMLVSVNIEIFSFFSSSYVSNNNIGKYMNSSLYLQNVLF